MIVGSKTITRRSVDPVLVVYDRLSAMAGIIADLRTDCVVDEVADAFETTEALATKRYACVVCRISASTRVEPFLRLVESATTSMPPLVFVVGTDVFIDDLASLDRMGAHWLAEHTGSTEIGCLVRAVRGTRSALGPTKAARDG